MRAILFAVVAAWVAGVPTMLRLLIFTEQLLAVVVGIGTALVLLDRRRGHGPALRAAAAAFALVVLVLFVAVAFTYPTLQQRIALTPPGAVLVGIVMIVGVLEATRRKTGPVLPILVGLMVVFVFLGPNLPETFQTRPVGFGRLVLYLGLDSNAMMGRVMIIATLVVIPFIVFGYLLNTFGGSVFFTGLATALVGRFRGGPAKVSVVGSAAFGMVSGSAVANVVAVGSVSIPLMARTGYRRHVAAAIEAVTSTGGQLMPPIMGASAFLMAEFLELPYRDIVVAAIVPSLFFYIALFLAVDFEARRLGIVARPTTETGLDDTGDWRRGWRFLIPIAVLLYLLFVERRTASNAAMMSVAALMAVHLFLPPTRVVAKLRQLVDGVLDAMAAATDIILLAATAGLIIGILNITGFSFAVTIQLLVLSNDNLVVLLALAGVLSLVLGMGMPTVGVYILLAILAAPALIELGVTPLAAHLYVLYFGMLSMITPPVAIASFSAASVAGTDPWRTAFASLKVGAGVYLVPIAFVAQPELLLIGDLADTVIAALRLLVAVTLFTLVFVGAAARPMATPLRVVGAPLAVVNVLPFAGGAADVVFWICLALSVVLLAWHLRPAGADPLAESSPSRP